MSILNLFKERKSHTVILESNGEPTEYKIPMSYTVEEIERLLEIQVTIDRLAKEPASKDSNKADKQVSDFFDSIFEQLLVLFNRYQPELTIAELKKIMTREEAQKVIAFHANEQILYAQVEGGKNAKKKVPKKS